MFYTSFQGFLFFGSGEKEFKMICIMYGECGHFWSWTRINLHSVYLLMDQWKISWYRPLLSEEVPLKNVKMWNESKRPTIYFDMFLVNIVFLSNIRNKSTFNGPEKPDFSTCFHYSCIWKSIWPLSQKIDGQPRIFFWANVISSVESLLLCTKFHGFLFLEKSFKGLFIIYEHISHGNYFNKFYFLHLRVF